MEAISLSSDRVPVHIITKSQNQTKKSCDLSTREKKKERSLKRIKFTPGFINFETFLITYITFTLLKGMSSQFAHVQNKRLPI